MADVTAAQKQRRRESPAGMSYYGAFRDCPRKYYCKYVLGITPTHTKPALIKGGCLHEAVAFTYGSKNPPPQTDVIKKYNEEMALREDEYEDGEQYLKDVNSGELMLQTWYGRWAEYDHKFYDIVEVEQQHKVYLGPKKDFFMTI